MAIINITKPKAANGTSGPTPTNGANGLDASHTQNGTITADSLMVTVAAGEGGDGGNGGANPGANGGKGGNASITVNGNIFNGAVGTTLSVDLHGNGGAGGLGGTGTPAGQMGNGGNSTVVANGNVLQPNKIMTLIELKARAHSGDGTVKGNAAATLNGNIIQNSKATSAVLLQAEAFTHGSDSVANNGNLNYGTKTATVNGNIVQGNINNVTVQADAYWSNGTANINGNIIQTNATNTGTVTMEATGNHISITNNKVQLGQQAFFLTVNTLSPYDTVIKNNEFKGTGLNAFTFTDIAAPGPHFDTVSINLATNTFIFNGDSNTITGFKSISVLGDVNSILTGTSGDDILFGGNGNDVINGGGGNDEIHGKGGDDTLDGGDGDDLLFGGAGDDTLLVSTGTDVLDGMTDPLGDTASFINATTGGVTVDLNSPGPHDYSTAFNNVTTITTLVNIQNVTGTNFADTLIGDAQNNTLTGGGGNDILRGNAGNDTLAGGGNSDTALYDGNFGQYNVAVNVSGDGTVADLRLGTPNGSDTLTSIEFIQFDDGVFNTATQTFVPNGPANTAPVLDPSKSPALLAEAEDAGAPSGAVGTLISSLVDFAMPAGQVDNVTDPDVGALLGIALTATDTANGTWWFSTNNGASWTAVGAVSDATARLLAADANTRLYFQPNANFNGAVPAAITFRAWDQTSGTNGTVGNASLNGGTTAFSVLTDTASLTVTAVNDAPVLDASKSPALTAVLEDAGAPGIGSGTLVSALVDFASPSGQVDNVTDPDAGALLGIALTGTDSANGTWLYSTNGGASWSAVGAVSDATALLLAADANTRLYFQPNANFSGPVPSGITFRAWDQTTGVNGTVADASVNGGATAFSAVNDTASITVTAVNDAPVLDATKSPALTAVLEDAGAPGIGSGTLVSALVDFASPSGQVDNVTDPDAGALLGIALTGTDSANGTWLYSTNGGASWSSVGAVSDATALLLAADANTRLYFQPNANFNGAVPTGITFRAWDQTSGTNGTTADASVNGGATAFSAVNDTASITVTAVNDAPVLDATKSPTLTAENQNIGAPVGAVGTLVSGLVDFASPSGQVDNVTDVDTGALLGIAVTGSDTANGSWWYSTDNGANWFALGAVSDPSARLLAADANTRLYFQPNLNFSGTVPAGITFRAWDQTSGVNGTLASAASNGGTTAFSAVTDTASITINGGENYFGTSGDDNHAGTAFDDIMHVSAGNDILNGGAHVNGDTLTFDTADAGVTATLNTLVGGYTVGGFAGTTSASNFEHLAGSGFNDVLTGDAGQNTITGGAGDDVLVATTGGDTLDGGTNTAVGDTASFVNGAGVTVDLSIVGSQNVGGGIGPITLTGIENLTGSGVADILYGNASANTLNGAGGDDFLVGNGGGDTLDGGTGTDTAEYGFTINPADITWDTGSSSFKFDTGSGIDTLKNVEMVEKSGDPRVLLVGGGGYATITAALAAALDGDTILVAPGTYNENIAVNSEVTIRGLGAPGDVVIHGTFATHNGSGATPVNEFLHGAYDVTGVGDGITVNANNVTLSNLTVEYFDSAIRASGPNVDDLTLDGVTLQHSVTGFYKSDATALNRLTIDGSTFSDDYYGVILANGVYPPVTNQDATDTTIINSTFTDLTEKGIYAETLQGTTLFDNLTMTNVGEFGRGSGFGALGTNGAGIDVNLKFHPYVGSVTISNFNFTDVGSSNQDGAASPHGNGAAIAIKGRDDLGHPQYGVVPADVSGLTVTIEDGTINGTSTGVRIGEGLKVDTAHNVTGPATTLDGVTVTNALTSEVDNDTHSTLTIIGTSGDDIYTSGQSPTSTGKIVFIADQGDDTYVGGTGGNNRVDYSAGIGTGPNSDIGVTVDLLAGSASGAGLGNDTLGVIQEVIGTDYNDVLIGDGDNNFLSGGDGNDVLYGHGGINTLSGGNGTDVAYYYGQETTYIVGGGPGLFTLYDGPEAVGDFPNLTPDFAVVERLKFLSPSDVSDIDNGGYGDLIFQDAGSGDLDIRTQEGPGSTLVTTGGTNWRVVGTGQFDPDLDRTADVLLQNTGTGDLKVITELTGAQTETPFTIQPGMSSWKAVATGDFNGDAASDVLLQHIDGSVEIMFLNTDSADAPGTVASVESLATPGSNWKAIAAGDFNNDGKSDILWQNSTTKAVEVYLMNGINVTNTPAIQATGGLTAIGTGDFNGDGNSDILFKNASNNAVLWFMNGAARTGTKTITKPGANFTLSGAADVDGNGYSDLIWSDTTTAPAVPVTTATHLGGPSSAVSTTVLGNFNITNPGAGFNLIASTGGG